MSARPCVPFANGGASVLEALVVLVLAMLIAQGAWSVLAGQVRATRDAAAAAERLDAARVGRYVLGEELRAGRPGRDWAPPAKDTIPLRAFRGLALPCPSDDLEGEVRVRYRGLRRPDPEKDSLLLLRPNGGWSVRALAAAGVEDDGTERCPEASGWSVERWTIEDAPPELVAARLFERGSYHVADGALRYRRGDGGRQPLTPDLLDDAASGLAARDAGRAVRLRFVFRACPESRCGPGWEATLRSSVP